MYRFVTTIIKTFKDYFWSVFKIHTHGKTKCQISCLFEQPCNNIVYLTLEAAARENGSSRPNIL